MAKKVQLQDIDENSLIIDGMDSGSSTVKTYSLPLTETTWVRLAKIKNPEKLTSAIFTLNCYGNYSYSDYTQPLTSSVFSVSCKYENKLEADILTITHTATPLGGDGSGDGSGDAGSGDAGSDGSGGSGGTTYGLISLTVEEYLGEIYVCGLINFPAIGTYDNCIIELLINNDTNINYLEQLEIVKFTDNDISNEESLIEGVSFSEYEDYKINLRTSLQNIVDCYENGTSVKINLHNRNGYGSYVLLDLPTRTNELHDATFNNNTWSHFDWADAIYNGCINKNGNVRQFSIILSTPNDDGAYVLNIYDNINENYSWVNGSHAKLSKLSGTLKVIEPVGFAMLKLNGVVVATSENQPIEYTCQNLIYGVDELILESSKPNISAELYLDLPNCEYEISMYKNDANLTYGWFNVTDIFTTHNDLYNFSLTYEAIEKHNTSEKVSLTSIEYSINDLRSSIIDHTSGLRSLKSDIEYIQSKLSSVSKDLNFISCSFLLDEIPDSYLEYNNNIYCGVYRYTTSVGKNAFYGCINLKNIEFKILKHLGNSAFGSCGELENVTLPETLETLGHNVFKWCPKLKSVTIPKNVTKIGHSIVGASGVETLVVDENNTTYDSRDNCNAIIETATNTLTSGCNSTVISNSIEHIGMYAFSGCSFSQLDIPTSVKSIGMQCFDSCSNLQSLTVPQECNIELHYTFNSCSSLEWVIIHKCDYINHEVFSNCISLKDIYFKCDTFVELIQTNSFDGCNAVNVHVIADLVETYKANSNWKSLIDTGVIIIIGDIIL